LIGFVFEGVRIDVRSYYQVDRKGIALGQFVQSRTNDRDLVIMAFSDAYFLDPRYLCYAQRRGWSIRSALLEPRAIEA